MPVVLKNLSDTEYTREKKHLLGDLECGAFVTVLTVGAALYFQSIAVMIFAILFTLVEIGNAYNFFCFCKRKQK